VIASISHVWHAVFVPWQHSVLRLQGYGEATYQRAQESTGIYGYRHTHQLKALELILCREIKANI